MRIYLFLISGLLLVGCGRQEESHREIINKLDGIKAELSKANVVMRWATVKKYDIMSAVSQWSSKNMEELKKREALPPETEEKIRRYEELSRELSDMQMEMLHARMPTPIIPTRARRATSPTPSPSPTPAPTQEEYNALAKKVAEAKEPVSTIVEERSRLLSEMTAQYSVERLVAEYAKGRFDVVVDTRDTVIYSVSGEAVDITPGVIALFHDKTKK